eukprot:14573763-Alexandrium_andersonii.AAC.1
MRVRGDGKARAALKATRATRPPGVEHDELVLHGVGGYLARGHTVGPEPPASKPPDCHHCRWPC